jgi:hypothetical protein
MFRIILITTVVMTALSLLLSQQIFAQEALNNIAINSTTNSTLAKFENLQNQYLSSWQKLGFGAIHDKFIKPFTIRGYGIYEIKPSNIFGPSDDVTLYLEPIGFTFKNASDENGNPLNSINLTADVSLFDESGTELVSKKDISFEKINSYNKISEIYMIITINQSPPTQTGDYKLKYTIHDGNSGNSFELVKDIKIANVEKIS